MNWRDQLVEAAAKVYPHSTLPALCSTPMTEEKEKALGQILHSGNYVLAPCFLFYYFDITEMKLKTIKAKYQPIN